MRKYVLRSKYSRHAPTEETADALLLLGPVQTYPPALLESKSSSTGLTRSIGHSWMSTAAPIVYNIITNMLAIWTICKDYLSKEKELLSSLAIAVLIQLSEIRNVELGI